MTRISKLITTAALAGLALVPGPGGRGDDASIHGLMERKLKESQKVLEGIAVNDMDAVAKHADELASLSRQAQWKVLTTPLYQLYTVDFQRSAEQLAKNARAKNLDAAALSYVEMTLTCVKCHKHVREVRMAYLPSR